MAESIISVMSGFRAIDLERLSYFESVFQRAKETTIDGDFLATNEQEEIRPEEPSRYTDFERIAAVGIFNEAIDKLAIIGADKPKVKPNCNFHPPKVRYYEKIRSRKLFDIDSTAVVDDGIIRTNKFQRERTLLEYILKLTRDELFENSSIECLTQYLNLEEKKIKEEHAICSTYGQYSRTIDALKSVAEESEHHTKSVLKEQTELSNSIEGELQESMFLYGIKLGYSRKWHEARLEQNTMKIQKEEGIVNGQLEEARAKMLNEDKIHKDIVLYLSMSIMKLNKDIENWKKRSEVDLTAKDNEIIEIRTKKSDEADKMRSMLRTYMRRRNSINDYLEVKRARLLAEEQRKWEMIAARRIQAWWRGTMVRWKLGEYAVKKKKKGKDKGNRKRKK
ncbi:IQ domain-containing protein G-like [Cimex lectularius]|uniref:Dynein regulatory complex protein 9 n=1 Tax=Cimex lectularius TaxID=79782 RepID=A0A8I6SRW1_CIMLE|nr:IQ domain-containing protein G-like [Cimex lectularius]